MRIRWKQVRIPLQLGAEKFGARGKGFPANSIGEPDGLVINDPPLIRENECTVDHMIRRTLLAQARPCLLGGALRVIRQ